MADGVENPNAPAPPDARDRPRVGVDTWVAEAEERRGRSGLEGRIRTLAERTPWWAWLAAGIAVGVLFGALSDSKYVLNVGILTLLYAVMALGLNVVVGWAGLLDLGYVAFWGLGAYGYVWLSSDETGIHLPAELTIPIVLVGVAIVGLLIGLTSWRLQGDYLAIVTLFVLEIFGNLAQNVDRIHFPYWGQHQITNDGLGIKDFDRFNFFGLHLHSVRAYFWLALVTTVIVVVALRLLDASRTGRAWRALREDPLAAELLSIPVQRLKLLAFVFAAAIAALSGLVFAAYENAVFPQNFTPEVLILVYAMLILGGTGSIAGAIVGAISIYGTLELLRSDTYQGYLFYGLVLGALVVAAFRRWRWQAPALAAATVVVGLVAHAIVAAAWPEGVKGHPLSGGFIGRVVDGWVIAPRDPYTVGRYAFVALVVAVILAFRAPGIWRIVALAPTLYLAACVWENVLLSNTPATRLMLLGAVLVVMMMARPQGLLGTSRVEIV